MMCDKRKAVLYCRVGPGKREAAGGLQLQREFLRKIARQRGLSVAGEVLACETGSTLQRPGWATALRAIQMAQAGVLLVTSGTRISRNTVELLQALRQLNAQGVEVQMTAPMQEQTMQLWTHFLCAGGG